MCCIRMCTFLFDVKICFFIEMKIIKNGENAVLKYEFHSKLSYFRDPKSLTQL